jgi:di/tricarboxylate transporter
VLIGGLIALSTAIQTSGAADVVAGGLIDIVGAGRPYLLLIAVAGAGALLTPIATPANMMVMGPGGYRFSDYWRLGLPVMLLWLVVAVVVIPIVWPFIG